MTEIFVLEFSSLGKSGGGREEKECMKHGWFLACMLKTLESEGTWASA